MWLFEVPQHNAEVAGFTSLSESTMANAYRWATTLNDDVRSKASWGPEDVVGREGILDLTIVKDSKGYKKNMIMWVRPASKGEKD